MLSLLTTSKSGKSDAGIVAKLYLPDDDLTVSLELSSLSSKDTSPSGNSRIMSAAFFAGIVISPGSVIVASCKCTSSSKWRSVLNILILSASHLISILLRIGRVCFLSATAARD